MGEGHLSLLNASVAGIYKNTVSKLFGRHAVCHTVSFGGEERLPFTHT